MKHILVTAALAVSLAACGPTTHSHSGSDVHAITVVSTQDFDATENRLRDGLANRNLKLFTVIDHGAGAKSIGEDIGQSKLFIFGNPKSGTPLMKADPTLGLHLPMKVLLHEADGVVHLHRTDMGDTLRRHGLTGQDQRLAKIEETLDAILNEAAN